MTLYRAAFAFKQPPYEYEYELLPIDCILGDERIRKELAAGVTLLEMEGEWQKELDDFARLRKPFLLYE